MTPSAARATLLGLGAILLWALLALFTASSGDVPPFQLAAMTFLLGGLAGAAASVRNGRARMLVSAPPRAWALGVGGLFGYHLLYFTALRAAPPAEASLVAFLWPLLIVLGAGAVTGQRLLAGHLAGAVLGFSGAALLVLGESGASFDPDHAAGYAAAALAAVVWASYSLLSRRVAEVPTDAVAGFCLATSALAALAHLAVETTVWPRGPSEWAAVAGLGLGPVGLAFYLWDAGMKRGNMALLGALSYLAPLLSTAALLVAGLAEPSWRLALAAGLITAGAAVASLASRGLPFRAG